MTLSFLGMNKELISHKVVEIKVKQAGEIQK